MREGLGKVPASPIVFLRTNTWALLVLAHWRKRSNACWKDPARVAGARSLEPRAERYSGSCIKVTCCIGLLDWKRGCTLGYFYSKLSKCTVGCARKIHAKSPIGFNCWSNNTEVREMKLPNPMRDMIITIHYKRMHVPKLDERRGRYLDLIHGVLALYQPLLTGFSLHTQGFTTSITKSINLSAKCSELHLHW